MGYPHTRVSMTSVHGQPQQGGYLPADIWHAYMAAVTEGQPCAEFPAPKEALSYQPFYGKFASTGQALSTSEGESEAGEKTKKHGSSRGGTKPGASTHGPASERSPAPPSPAAPGAAAPPVTKSGGAEPALRPRAAAPRRPLRHARW